MRFLLSAALVVFAPAVLAAEPPRPAAEAPRPAEPDAWSACAALVGHWTGEGGGKPGEAKGGFSFEKDLQGTVLVRRNHADYPPQQGRPAFTHDDLMIVYREGGATKARYFDNEGHVIDYDVTASDGGKRIVFVSPKGAGGPRFRFTYVLAEPGRVTIDFEIAPPSAPDDFKKYISASARRDVASKPK